MKKKKDNKKVEEKQEVQEIEKFRSLLWVEDGDKPHWEMETKYVGCKNWTMVPREGKSFLLY